MASAPIENEIRIPKRKPIRFIYYYAHKYGHASRKKYLQRFNEVASEYRTNASATRTVRP